MALIPQLHSQIHTKAMRFVIVLRAVCLMAAGSALAQGQPQATASETPGNAQEAAKPAQQTETQKLALAAKIRDISPNKKFAMRISYDADTYRKMFPTESAAGTLQRALEEEYFAVTVKGIDLISLPEKLAVGELPWDGSAEHFNLVWSQDSKWCAFYANTARWGLTWVYHLRRDKFVPLSEKVQQDTKVEPDAGGTWTTPLEIDVEGDVRREWLKPIRWIKPGVLLLEQSVIFRGADAGEATYRLTASFDEKTGKFQIVSKKKVPPTVEE
jgi:hypothetical protein